MTLTEVLVGAALATLVIMGFAVVDASRARIHEDLRHRQQLAVAHVQLAAASSRLTKGLEEADRIVILNTGIDGENPYADPPGPDKAKIKLRRLEGCPEPPTSACLDSAATYHWDEYRLKDDRLEYLQDSCATPPATPTVLVSGVRLFTVRFKDESAAPPGGEPFPSQADSNIVEYAVEWTDGASAHRLNGEVTNRLAAYSNLRAAAATGGDSGSGLAPRGVSDPPAPCP